MVKSVVLVSLLFVELFQSPCSVMMMSGGYDDGNVIYISYINDRQALEGIRWDVTSLVT